jgi:hypothetical protein
LKLPGGLAALARARLKLHREAVTASAAKAPARRLSPTR